jgi:hypothetical protein
VPGHGAILGLGWSMSDRNGIGDTSTLICFLEAMRRTPDWSVSSQELPKFLFQDATGHDLGSRYVLRRSVELITQSEHSGEAESRPQFSLER